MQHGTSVIPKATSDDHVVGNLDVLDWELSSEDYEVNGSALHSKPVCMSIMVSMFRDMLVFVVPLSNNCWLCSVGLAESDQRRSSNLQLRPTFHIGWHHLQLSAFLCTTNISIFQYNK